MSWSARYDLMVSVFPTLLEGRLEFRGCMGVEFTSEIQYLYRTYSVKSNRETAHGLW